VALERLLMLYRDMDKALASHAWLAGDALQHRRRGIHALHRVRLEHLDVMGCSIPPRVPPTGTAGSRPATSFQAAIVRWENDKYPS
jgi:hypothetical protein